MTPADDTWGRLATITVVGTFGEPECTEGQVFNNIKCTFYDSSEPTPQIIPDWNREITAPRGQNYTPLKPTLTIPSKVGLTKITVKYTSADLNPAQPSCYTHGVFYIGVAWRDPLTGAVGQDACYTYSSQLTCLTYNTWTYDCGFGDQIRGISAYSMDVQSQDAIGCPSANYQGSVFFNVLFHLARVPVAFTITSLQPLNVPGTNANMVADSSSFDQVQNLAASTQQNASCNNVLSVTTELQTDWISSTTNETSGQTWVGFDFNIGTKDDVTLNLRITELDFDLMFNAILKFNDVKGWNKAKTETTRQGTIYRVQAVLNPCTATRYVLTGVNTGSLSRGGQPSNSLECYADGEVVWYSYTGNLPDFTQNVTNYYLKLTAVGTFFDFYVVQNDLSNPCVGPLTCPTGPTGPGPTGPGPTGPGPTGPGPTTRASPELMAALASSVSWSR